MSDRARHLIETLGLAAHPEGGHYREIYRSSQQVDRNGAARASVTTIYFLLRAGEHSRWHVVDSDEVWHFYEGAPLELITLDPTTPTPVAHQLGPDEVARVSVVPAGHWQAARSTGDYSLVGCTVAPGFEFDDFRFVADLPNSEAASKLGDYAYVL